MQGSSMAYGLHMIFPLSNALLASEALLVTVVAFIIADKMRAPLSLSMSLVGLLVGLSTSRHLQIDYTFTSTIIAMWFVAPIISVVFAFLTLKVINRTKPKDVWRRVRYYKALLVGFSFFASYVLGANTIGMIVAVGGFDILTVFAAILAILFGCLFLSDREIRRVGEDVFSLRYSNALVALVISTILVEFATLLAIPLSSTQTLTAAVLGTGASYANKAISLRPFLVIVVAWIIVPMFCFVIGYFL